MFKKACLAVWRTNYRGQVASGPWSHSSEKGWQLGLGVAVTEEVEKGVVWGSTDLSGVAGAMDVGGELREALRMPPRFRS